MELLAVLFVLLQIFRFFQEGMGDRILHWNFLEFSWFDLLNVQTFGFVDILMSRKREICSVVLLGDGCD